MKLKNVLLLILLIAAAIIVGSLIASLASGSDAFSWLAYGKSFGISAASPAVIDLSIARLAFGFEINITVSHIICLFIAIALFFSLKKKK